MLKRQASIFLIVGLMTVTVDFTGYHIALWAGLSYPISKVLGFVLGTVFAYFVNRRWTFGKIQHSANSAPRFIVLYACTLGANVGVNQTILFLSKHSSIGVSLGFLLATGISAILNFIGMKFFVFRDVSNANI